MPQEDAMIDWTRATEPPDEVGADAFKDITQVFLLEVSEALAELTNDTPRQTLEERLHFIRGCSLNLGFKAFSTLCHQAETQATKGQVKTINVADLVNSYEASYEVFVTNLPVHFS
jgi:HPt (histidine-containing phosphotransfer) domain-containing protein